MPSGRRPWSPQPGRKRLNLTARSCDCNRHVNVQPLVRRRQGDLTPANDSWPQLRSRNAIGLRFVRPQAGAEARTLTQIINAAWAWNGAASGVASQLAMTLLLFTTLATCRRAFDGLAWLTGFDTFAVFTWLACLKFLAAVT